MNAELTAENRPACVIPGLAFSTGCRNLRTYKDERRVQVFVVLSSVISVELFGFSAVHGKEVGPRVIGPQWIEELLEGRIEAGYCEISDILAMTMVGWIRDRTYQLGSIWTSTGSCG